MKTLLTKFKNLNLKQKLVLTLFVLSLLSLFYLLSSVKPQKNNQNTTVVSIIPQISPIPGKVSFGGTTNSISLFFSIPIDPSSVVVTSEPQLSFQIKTLPDFPNRIILLPQQEWKTNTKYKINILNGVKALQGGQISTESIVFEYETTTPELPVFDRPN